MLPVDSFKVIAESVGVQNLKDDVAAALAQDIEYRLRDIIQEALKFMRHSKRTKLSTADINHALKVRNVEKLYGFSSSSPLQFKKVSGSFGNLFYLDDEELDFDDIVNAPMPKVPLDIVYTAHWLAIEGVQPAIPQNPAQIETKIENLSKKLKAEGKFDLLEQKADVKPLVRHVITKELQLYYEKITEALLSDSEVLRNTALESIREDQGIQQLLPYFIQFVMDQISKNLKVLVVHKTLLLCLAALLENPNLFVEPYLHQFMPPILTSVVAKKICDDPKEDHWNVRRFGASVMASICQKYGDSYTTLQTRVAKTLLKTFLDPLKALTTHYGAIVGLSALGPSVTKALILPNLKDYMKILLPAIEDKNDEIRHMEAQKCFEALSAAAKSYIQSHKKHINTSGGADDMNIDSDLDINSIEYGAEIVSMFGDRMLESQ